MINKNTISYYKNILTTIFLLVMAWGLRLQFVPNKTTIWNYLYNSGYAVVFLFAGISSILLIRKIKILGAPQKALNISSLALISYGVGLVIWTFYNFYYGSEIPFPSAPDMFFVIFYPLVLVSVFYYLQIFSLLLNRRVLIEALVLLLFLSLIIFSFFNLKITPEMPILEKILDIFYPFSSALVLSAAVMILRVGGGAIGSGATFLSLGLATHGIADFFFSYRTASGTYWNGDYTDIFFALSAYLMGMSSLIIISKLIPEEKNMEISIEK